MAAPKQKNEDGQAWRDSILESIADGVFTVDQDWRITYFNRAAEKITGIKRQEALGRKCFEVFKANICEEGCFLRKSLESKQANLHKSAYIVRNDGKRVPISISTAVLRDDAGAIIGGVETFRSLAAVEALRKELKQRYSFQDIVSKNKKMQELFQILPQVAESDASVLIEGESGTGKELFARALHSLSRRKQGPLVAVNCGALPDTLLESELFGYRAGAFTDARADHPGRFALADGGTIFLDEIGDVSPALQVRLLRVLQEKTIEPLGATQSTKVDVRVVAASNRSLEELVRDGSFREDLYYRINVVSLRIPPLRERRDDIPLLVEHFIAHFNHLTGKDISQLDPAAMALLLRHEFPGNVRELMNIIEHAFVLCPGGVLMTDHLPAQLWPRQNEPNITRPQNLDDAQAQLIGEALARNGYHQGQTAAELGIHKTTLWRKMKKLGIELPKKKRS